MKKINEIQCIKFLEMNDNHKKVSNRSQDNQITSRASKSFPRLTNHSPGSKITPQSLKLTPGLPDHSPGHQITPLAPKSFPGLSNHSPGSQINPRAFRSIATERAGEPASQQSSQPPSHAKLAALGRWLSPHLMKSNGIERNLSKSNEIQ